eukprot:2509749-Pyramimonas_sp.AAC.1
MLLDKFKVDSPNVVYEADSVTAKYEYHTTELTPGANDTWSVKPVTKEYTFKTTTKVPKLGMMLVGLG